MSTMAVQVLKADGTFEVYKEEKLRRSLKKAGATQREVTDIAAAIQKTLYDGIKTEIIYREAFELLRSNSTPKAARYSLRRALFSLGPTGFPFEDFLAELLRAEGYSTKTRLQLRGKCVTHEIDVVAYRPGECILVEAKFHMRPGIKSDLQDVLYSYARFLDLQDKKVHKKDTCGIERTLIATNTKFTTEAEKYAKCSGLELLSWDQPKGNSLQDRVERAGIYPITALSTLSQKDKRMLIGNGVILCREILDNQVILKSIGCSTRKIAEIIEESRNLCKK